MLKIVELMNCFFEKDIEKTECIKIMDFYLKDDFESSANSFLAICSKEISKSVAGSKSHKEGIAKMNLFKELIELRSFPNDTITTSKSGRA